MTGSQELDIPEVTQEAHVVADSRKRLVQCARHLDWAVRVSMRS
jgi:bacteriorhodopsin